ncbi:MAG: O-antigen ligase family protein [Deltaproteobacteria bacterium]|nr:O-antigen ligase family protein [Deltaproteobacteria bacterium]
MASAYVISAVAVSQMPGWNVAVRVIAAVYAIIHLLCFLARRIRMVKPNAVHVLIIIWSVVGVIGGYETLNLSSLFARLWTMVQLIGVSYLLYSLAVEMKSLKWLEWSFLLGVFVSLLWLIVTTGGHLGSERISGTEGNPNVLAFILLLNCVISLDLLWQYRNMILKGIFLANIAFSYPFLLATGSRKGILGFFLIVGISWMLTGTIRNRGKRLLSMMCAGLAVILALGLFISRLEESPYFGRIQNIERFVKGERLVKQERSLPGRAEMIKRGTELALKNPFFGVGLDQFRYYNNSLSLTSIDQSYSHSNVIEVLADTGFIGFAIYYSAYVIILLKLLYLRKKCPFGPARRYLHLSFLIGIIVVIYDLFSVTYYTKGYWFALTLILCAIVLARGQIEHRRVNNAVGSFKRFPVSQTDVK